MAKIGVIGAGAFGICAALELKKRGFEVLLFDKQDNILKEASTINHLRHHYGYHYPRSPETVKEIQRCSDSFLKAYGKCVDRNLVSFYGVAKEDSKVTSEQYTKFCDELKLPYEIQFPDHDIINRTRIDLCLKTPEPVYSPKVLAEMMMQALKKNSVDLRLGTEIVGGNVKSKSKRLETIVGGKKCSEKLDGILNATYSGINEINRALGLPTRTIQYELMEMLEIKIPSSQRWGLTIIDGEFSSIMPRDNGTYALADVNYSVLSRSVSDHLTPEVVVSKNMPSNRDQILKRGIGWYPFLKDAEVVRSLNVTKVVKARVDNTDERLTEVKKYCSGVYSVFGGKVLTCVETAKEIADKIEAES